MKELIKKVIGSGAVSAYHRSANALLAGLAGNPTKGMTVIGVTGTNGKTTTCNLIASIFETAGHKVALATTIQFRINGKETINEAKMTVLPTRKLNTFLKAARDAKCDVLILEVTSIALDQNRMSGIHFDTGVLTNITHDHLDYHKTFNNYVQSKRKLFARDLRLAVLNADDKYGTEFSKITHPSTIMYSIEEDPETLHVAKASAGDKGQELLLGLGNTKLHIKTKLLGKFNQSNILAAVAVGLGHGLAPEIIEQGINKLESVAGRMQSIDQGQSFGVIVDYAHTPDALEKMYAALKSTLKKDAKIISVLGSCGDRDKTKRPVLGQIAGREAAYVIITNEDPYTEDPQSIIDAVAAGINQGNPNQEENKTYWSIYDRREAIAKAFELARPGDIVTITGKGAETAMVWGHEYRPWSDAEVAKEELAKIKSS